jgi:hypothetical protein
MTAGDEYEQAVQGEAALMSDMSSLREELAKRVQEVKRLRDFRKNHPYLPCQTLSVLSCPC